VAKSDSAPAPHSQGLVLPQKTAEPLQHSSLETFSQMNYRDSVAKNSRAMKPMRRFNIINTPTLATAIDPPALPASTDIKKAASNCTRKQE
jgi:hypothetical protein